VVHTCNSNTQEAECAFETSLGQICLKNTKHKMQNKITKAMSIAFEIKGKKSHFEV
jgi:hypothetical protein